MLLSLIPKERRFFELFNQHGDKIVEGAGHLVALLNGFSDERLRQEKLTAIDACEMKADDFTRETIALLQRSFVTPFDRDDMHRLINQMDDILDLTQDVAETMELYDLRRISLDAIQLAQLSEMGCLRVKDAVNLLDDMNNADTILKLCDQIDQIESDADRVMRSAMSKLFRNESDILQVIKLKAVYELLEALTDKCEDVADVIEGIVLQHA
jgi:predicted phosphate transport protein (TIGR00153 family)